MGIAMKIREGEVYQRGSLYVFIDGVEEGYCYFADLTDRNLTTRYVYTQTISEWIKRAKNLGVFPKKKLSKLRRLLINE